MPSTEEDYIENEYYTHNRRLFRLIGLWEYQRSSKKLIYVCFVNLIIIISLFEQIYAIFMSEKKLSLYTKLLEIILPTIGVVSCYYNLISNAAIMKKIFYRINYDWNELANKRELIILKNYATLSRKCTIAMIISFYVYAGFVIFTPFLCIIRYLLGSISYTELVLPISIDFFMKNHLTYYFGFWHQCIMIIIIRWKINERFKENRNNCHCNSENINLSEENEWIVDVIKFYKTVIEFVDLIKLFYEATNMLEAFLALVIIMILSTNISNTEGLTKLSYVIGSMSVIFAYFYFGQKLIDHSNNVFLTM
ncbi:odorant receptor 46a-like isoform X1 [Vespula maculifrons]|uniref:Odorant receptor 46a-like isoform X1 n=1 Tax=Vespula maculifrons TaxID=7453 RepID=A0ABD2BPC9_VESMC